MLDPRLPHIGLLGAANRIRPRARERWTEFFQDVHAIGDAVLLFGRQPVPPRAELFGELDLSGHRSVMYLSAYIIKGIPGHVPPGRNAQPDRIVPGGTFDR